MINNPIDGKAPLEITNPGPSRPHSSLVKFCDETKEYCEIKNWPIAGVSDYQIYPRWQGTLTISSVKEPDDQYIIWSE
jgi:hypothetical protein